MRILNRFCATCCGTTTGSSQLILKVVFKKTPQEIDELVRLQNPENKLELMVESSTFRAGILDILMKEKSVVDAAGIAIVSRIAGSAEETFDHIDKDSSGSIEFGELSQLLSVRPSSLYVMLTFVEVTHVSIPAIPRLSQERPQHQRRSNRRCLKSATVTSAALARNNS